jgi:hypothetical protein
MAKYGVIEWKVVKQSLTVPKICPRCNNNVDFVLVYDKIGITVLGLWLVPTKIIYALHCPICRHYEDISKLDRNNLMR